MSQKLPYFYTSEGFVARLLISLDNEQKAVKVFARMLKKKWIVMHKDNVMLGVYFDVFYNDDFEEAKIRHPDWELCLKENRTYGVPFKRGDIFK